MTIGLRIKLIDKAGETLEQASSASEGERLDGTMVELCHLAAVKKLIDSFFADLGDIYDGDRIELVIGGGE